MSIPYQRGISPQLLPAALFLHYESCLHSAQRPQCRPTSEGGAVTPEPATCALLSAMQSRWSEQVSRPFVVGDGYPSFQWLISLFFSSSSTVVQRQTHSRILFPPVRVCCGRRTPNAFLSSTRRLRSRTTGTRQARAIFLGGFCIGEVLPDRRPGTK